MENENNDKGKNADQLFCSIDKRILYGNIVLLEKSTFDLLNSNTCTLTEYSLIFFNK